MYPSNEENPVNQLIDALDVAAVNELPSDEPSSELSFSETIKAMVASANENVLDARKVMPIEAMTVAQRSLSRSIMSQDAQARAFTALREVSDYINMATTGTPSKISQNNTDLLPIGHPLSTSTEYASLLEKIEKRSEWFAADSRISEEYRPVVASAYLTVPDTVERQFSIARLESADAQDVPREVVLAIIAASNPFSGENSFLARSARAKLQRRDRRGRFAWMGGGARFFTRGLKGFIDSVVGKFVGSDPKTNTFDVEVFDHPTLGTGIFRIPATNVEGVKAYIGGKLGKMLSLKGKASADYARDYALDVNTLQKIDAPSGWVAGGNGFVSADGYYAIKHEAGAALPDLERHKEQYGAEVKGLGENGALDPKYPVYEVMTNPLSQPRGRFTESGNESIGYYQSWGDVQAGVSRYDRKNDQKRAGSVQRRMWGDVPQGEFPKNTFDAVTPADPEKGLPYSTYRTKNNAKDLGGFTVRRYQPAQHKEVQQRMEANVKNGAIVNGFRSGSTEIEDDQPIFEITRQVAPWEDKNIKPEVIGYAQDWEDVQAIAENNETTSPRQPNPRDKKARDFKNRLGLEHVHDDDVITPEDFIKQEDGSYATEPSSDEALRSTVIQNAQGRWVSEVYNDKKSQDSFDPASRRTYDNPEQAIENAAEWMTEENDSRSDRPKTELELREERQGQMLYSGDPKATLPEDLGTPNSPEVKETLAKVGIDLQTTEEDKTLAQMALEMDASVPSFLFSPEVVNKDANEQSLGTRIMVKMKRLAEFLPNSPDSFKLKQRPDDQVLDEMDAFIENSQALTAAARARISQRMRNEFGDDIFEKLASVVSGNEEEKRLQQKTRDYARTLAEKQYEERKDFLESMFIRVASEGKDIRDIVDPKQKNLALQKALERSKEDWIQGKIDSEWVKIVEKPNGDKKQALEWYALENNVQEVVDMYKRRIELRNIKKNYVKASDRLGVVSREEYQQLFKDLDIPMYEGDGSEFISFDGIRRRTMPDPKMSDSVDLAKESIKWALRSYPAAVVEKMADYVKNSGKFWGGMLPVDWSPDGRGGYRDGTELTLSTHAHDSDIPLGGSVGVHELGHLFEQAYPELKSMEWGFLFSQILPKNPDGSRPNAMDDSQDRNAISLESYSTLGRNTHPNSDEVAFYDMFRERYTGRVYFYDRQDGLNLELNSDSAYEVFTVGTERILSARHDVLYINNSKVVEAYENGELSAEDMLIGANSDAFTMGMLVKAAKDKDKTDSASTGTTEEFLSPPPILQEDLGTYVDAAEADLEQQKLDDDTLKKAADSVNRAAEIANGIKNPQVAEAARRQVDALRYRLSGLLDKIKPIDAFFKSDLNAKSDKEAITKNEEVLKRLKRIDISKSRSSGARYWKARFGTTHIGVSHEFEYEAEDGEKFQIKFSLNRAKVRFGNTMYIPPHIKIYDSNGERAGGMQMSIIPAGATDPRVFVRDSDADSVNTKKPFYVISSVFVAPDKRRKGLATAALEAVRQSTNIPVYHSKYLGNDGVGEAFANAVQSSSQVLEEDLGVSADTNVSAKSAEVRSRLKRTSENKIVAPKGVPSRSQYNFDYEAPEGQKYTVTSNISNFGDANEYTGAQSVTAKNENGGVATMTYRLRNVSGESRSQLLSLISDINLEQADLDKPFYTITGVNVGEEFRRQGIATAMLEAARQTAPYPIYHSAVITDRGRGFAEAVQSTAATVDEDLGTSSRIPDSEKSRSVLSRLKKADEKTTKTNYPTSTQSETLKTFDYTSEDGEKFTVIVSQTKVTEKEPVSPDLAEYYFDPLVNIQDSEGNYVGGMLLSQWDAGTDPRGIVYIPPDEAGNYAPFDKNKPFNSISSIYVNAAQRRKGLATAMLEAARESLDAPVYHSPILSDDGRQFANSVQSSAQVVEEDLGAPSRSDVPAEYRSVKQRLTKSAAEPRKLVIDGVEHIRQDFDYTDPQGNEYIISHTRPAMRQAEAIEKNIYMVAEHNVMARGKETLLLVGDMDYSMYPVGYGAWNAVADVNISQVDEDKPYYTISGILVRYEFRRRGLATAMLEAARSDTDFPIYHSKHLSEDGREFAAGVQSPAQVLDEDLGDVRDRVSPSQALFERVTSKIPEEKRLAQEEIKSRIKSNNDLKSSVRELDLSGQFANKEFPKVRTVTETGEYVTKDGKKIILSRHDQWDIDNEGREYLSRGSVEAYLPAEGAYDTGAGSFIEPTEVDPWPIGSFYYSEAKSYYIVDDNSREKLRWDETEVGGSSENVRIDNTKPFTTVDWVEVDDSLQREGIATAMMEFARTNAGMPIYHDATRTPSGSRFADAVQSSSQVMEEDLGEEFTLVFQDKDADLTPQKRIRKRVKSDNNLETEISEEGKRKNITETGEYTDADGNRFQLVRDDRWSINQRGEELRYGKVLAYPYEPNGEVDINPVALVTYAEPPSETLPDGSRRWWPDAIGGSSLDDPNFDEFKPFSTINMIEVDEDFQRRGLATAILEFARTNAGMPIYHSSNLTDDGEKFAGKVQSSQTPTDEDLGSPTPKDLNAVADEAVQRAKIGKKIDLGSYPMNRGQEEDNPKNNGYKTDFRKMKEVIEAQGWDKPAIGVTKDEFRELWNSAAQLGLTRIFRGAPNNASQELVDGKPFIGNGVIGPGTYVSTNYSRASQFASSEGYSVMEMLVPNELLRSYKDRTALRREVADRYGDKYMYDSDAPFVVFAADGNGAVSGEGWSRFSGDYVIYNTSAIIVVDPSTETDRVQSQGENKDEDLGTYRTATKKKIEIPPLAEEPPLEKDRDPKAVEAAKKVRKLAEQMEPEVTKIMTTLAETLDGDLDQLDQRLKSTDSLARKIKDDANKDFEGDIDQSAEKVSDSIRYTMTVDGSRYTDSVRRVIARFEQMGYEVRVKNFWEGGDPYQGINMKLTKNGVTVEFQMHTPESLQIKVDQLHEIYEEYRKIDTEKGQDLDKLDAKMLFWEKMIGIASQIPNPDNYDELLNIGTLVQQQFEL